MSFPDPNEAYDVIPFTDPKGWWTVRCNGVPVRHFPGKANADRYAIDPQYRASLVTDKLWNKNADRQGLVACIR